MQSQAREPVQRKRFVGIFLTEIEQYKQCGPIKIEITKIILSRLWPFEPQLKAAATHPANDLRKDLESSKAASFHLNAIDMRLW